MASVDIMPRGQKITSDLHIQNFKTLADTCYETSTSHIAEITHQQDTAGPHTILKTKAVIIKFTTAVVPHPPYSPYHAPTHFHLFGALNEAINGKRFGSDGVTGEVAAYKNSNWHIKGTYAVVPHW